jgi:methylase of polypeptide subunit release factors
LCALIDCEGPDTLRHARWIEILGRKSVNRRFFRELERLVHRLARSLGPLPSTSDADELALLYVSRLLFLSFVEAKGWLNLDRAFLANRFADCMVNGGGYHTRVLKPLFFGTLNTHPAKRSLRSREFGRIPFLNGGLFARSSLEARLRQSLFPDEALGELFGDLLARYRFTAREDAATWSEAAIDPEMLGKAFESLMASHYRKTSGAFYTPQLLVREVTSSALSYAVGAEASLDAVAELRVLDPACGSGAFLVHVMEEISTRSAQLGDRRPPHLIRRDVLTRSIFGVDINPVAVWLCQLRLWLSMVIDDPETNPLRVTALPNLDRNIRVGDSLSGGAFGSSAVRVENRRVAVIRGRYARATGSRKRSLSRLLDAMERRCAITASEERLAELAHQRREILTAARSRDLFGSRSIVPRDLSVALRDLRKTRREVQDVLKGLRSGAALPFAFAAHFADTATRGGFDVVLGNPPWIRTHHLDRNSRESLRSQFQVYRSAVWEAGAKAASAGKGFGSQVDAAALFIEQSLKLTRDGGVVALIVPAKLWRSLAGGGARQLLATRSEIMEVHDLTQASQQFDAAVYPSVVVAKRAPTRPLTGCVKIQSAVKHTVRRFVIQRNKLQFDDTPGSPWIAVPAPVRRAFDTLRGSRTVLAESQFGRPLLGVKTGCNSAFIMTRDEARERSIEPPLLRPVLRGDLVGRNRNGFDEVILFTHDEAGPLQRLPPGASMWLSKWRRELELRADLRPSDKWWRLFRTECVRSQGHHVVWADINKSPRVSILSPEDRIVPLNTCYVLATSDHTDARAVAALLSSPVTSAWLGLLAEPVRGGYRRYFGWTIALLPVPDNWKRARSILAPLFGSVSPGDLQAATLEAYDVSIDSIQPLLDWDR